MMMEKPTTADEEQRRRQTQVSREQSGLPPEEDAAGRDARERDAEEGASPDRKGTETRPARS
jgi:hypothetical protein